MKYAEAMQAWTEECYEIAEQCREEGYPDHGSNYDLRITEAWKYYEEQIDDE